MGHLTAIQVIDYIVGFIYLAVALFIISIFALGAGAVGLSGSQGSGAFAFLFGTVGMVIGGFAALFGILSIVSANALVKGRLWSKIVHLIVAIIWNLWIFPLGTAFAIYCIWVLLFNPELKDHFSSSPSFAGDGFQSSTHSDSGGFDF